ncbi:hypothetical protein FRC11_001722 [Ceratobasidium sp. 423]|nr:hypothetical protein FRC11_001722 [Ceratobasidium sp. 423]
MSHPLPAKPSAATTAAQAVPAPSRTAPTYVPTLVPSVLAATSSLLISSVGLPSSAAVECRAWTGPDDAVESARKHVFGVAAGAPDISAALAAVVSPDVPLTLWAFAVVGEAGAPRLAALDFDDIGLRETTPATNLYALAPNAPLVPGTPLRLLPAFAPAYALAPYSGPTPSGPFGFPQSLGKRGVPPSATVSPCILVWLPLPPAAPTSVASPSGLPTPSAATPAATAGPSGSRGMYAIWPRTLCVVDSKLATIDVAKLPGLPPGLSTQGPGWTKPRRFGVKKSKLSKPVLLSQQALTLQPSTSGTTLDIDPSLVSLANTASNLIDAVVRAREKEKEKQRARMERARSGSAVPIPALGSTSGVATGPSTPVDAVHPINTPTAPQPPPQLHPHPQPQPQTQIQTPTSLVNTPIQYVGSASAALNPPLLQQPLSASPAAVSDTFMELFGDDFNVPTDQDTVFPDLTSFPELDSWNVPEVQADAKSNDEVRESDFDFFGVPDSWGGNAPETQPQLMDVDLVDLGLAIEPSPKEPTPVPIPSPPYFPLTPPQKDETSGDWEPLKFGQKYEDVDGKYRRLEGKFGVRGRLIAPQPRPRARTLTQTTKAIEGVPRVVRTQSFSVTPTSALARRMEVGLGLGPRSMSNLQQQAALNSSHLQPQPQAYLRPYPLLQLHHLPKFQLRNQLPTPSPSPNAHRKLRSGVLGSGILGDVLTWPSDPKESKTPAPISVPTPVSPGEVFVEAVEASVNVLAREAVDNWAWGTDQHQIECLHPPLPSRNELMLLGSCLASLAPGSEMSIGKLTAMAKVDLPPPGILTDRPYPQLPRLEKLRQPKVSIGHSGQVVQMNPPALRFWEAAGLEPVGGAKDIVAYAVFEEGEEAGVVRRWMERVAQVYETRRLGKHAIGEMGGGVVPVKWESVAKSLVLFVSSLPQTQSHIVLYLIIPQRAFASPALRSFIPTLESNSFISTLSEHRSHLSIHLVPASLLFDHSTTPPESRQRLECTVLSVYDRVPRTIGRRIRREIIPLEIPAQTTVHVPAYTLARPLAPRFRFSMDWPDTQREVLDRHMFLHVGYGFSKSKRWLGVTCVDERGEAYETKVWKCEDMTIAKVIAKVWSFAMRFAKRAALEWRIVFCKMGVMELDEVEAWEAHTSVKMAGDMPIGMHVSVLRFDLTTGLVLSTSASPSVKAPPAPPGTPPSTVIDLMANDYLVLPGYDTEVCTIPELESPMADLVPSLLPLATAHYFRLTDPPITRPMGRLADIPPKPDDPPVGVLSSQLHLLHVNLTQNSSLWKSGGDPWRELLQSFYALSALTQARFSTLDPLPIHLAMLNVILGVSDNRELVPVDLPPEPLS